MTVGLDELLVQANRLRRHLAPGRTKRSWKNLLAANCLSPSQRLKFFTHAIASGRKPICLRIAGEYVCIRPWTPDLRVARENLLRGEFRFVNLLPSAQGQIVIDAGGYIGTAAIALHRQLPTVQVVSLEPDPGNFELLCRNVGGFANIIPIHAALAAYDGWTELLDRGTGPWGFTTVKDPADSRNAMARVTVRTITVESILQTFHAKEVCLLKLDIEGGEYELLKDHPPWLRLVEAIVVEVHERIQPGAESVVAELESTFEQFACDGEKKWLLRKKPRSISSDRYGCK